MARHIHCCFRDTLVSRLQSVPDIAVGVGRFDDWIEEEYIPERGGVNVVIGTDNPTGEAYTVDDPETYGKLGGKVLCLYKSELSFTVEIYVTDCEDTFCLAKEIEADVLPELMRKIKGTRKTVYNGSTPTTSMEKAKDFTLIVLNFTIEYDYSPERPNYLC